MVDSIATLPVPATPTSAVTEPVSKPPKPSRATLRPGLHGPAVAAHVVGQRPQVALLAGRPDERVRGGEAVQRRAEVREAHGAGDDHHAGRVRGDDLLEWRLREGCRAPVLEAAVPDLREQQLVSI